MHQSDGDRDTDDGPTRKYADIDLSNGSTVIYDTENHDAWIESTVAVDFSAL